MRPSIVTAGSAACKYPGCKIALVLLVGKNLPRFCWDHMPALHADRRTIDAEPLRGRITAPNNEGEDNAA